MSQFAAATAAQWFEYLCEFDLAIVVNCHR